MLIRSACSDHSHNRSALQNFCLASSLASLSLGASTSSVLWQISICRPLPPSTSFMKLMTKRDIIPLSGPPSRNTPVGLSWPIWRGPFDADQAPQLRKNFVAFAPGAERSNEDRDRIEAG